MVLSKYMSVVLPEAISWSDAAKNLGKCAPPEPGRGNTVPHNELCAVAQREIGVPRTSFREAKESLPENFAFFPRFSSILRRRLYLPVLSARAGAPVLICPQPMATAMSAMHVSSLSPDRWETMTLYLLRRRYQKPPAPPLQFPSG